MTATFYNFISYIFFLVLRAFFPDKNTENELFSKPIREELEQWANFFQVLQ